MRVVLAAVSVCCLVVLLTWLSLQSTNVGAEPFDQALAEVDHFAMLEAALHRDVLSARVGMLRDYDALVRETDGLDASLGRMSQIANQDPPTQAIVKRIAESVADQEALVEQFKSDNALLQNSLAYFSRFSFHLDAAGRNAGLAPGVSALVAAMLRLTLDTSAATAEDVQDRLNEVRRRALLYDEAAALEPLLAHGQLLHTLLPETDRILKRLDALPIRGEQTLLRTLFLKQQSKSRATARQFRRYLYFASLVLVGLLIHVGLQLRARADALRRRAAFEHVVAGISMRFINSQAQQLDADIEQALADMGNCVDADRIYFQLCRPVKRTYSWCTPGVALPPDWPDRASAVVRRYSGNADGAFRIARIGKLPPGEDRRLLSAAGLEGWACVARADADGITHLLGFDTLTHPCRIKQDGELGLLRTALDAISNAFDRRALEQERARLQTRLNQAQRLETVGAFASGVAHNFNNIIGAILGYTEIATDQSAANGVSSPILEDIRRAGERARDLVGQILTFGRQREVSFRSVCVHALVTEAVSLLRASLPATVSFVVPEASSCTAVVLGVTSQLQQVILNLCSNASHAMEDVGLIELDIGISEFLTAETLSHGILAPGKYVRVSVTDSGIGMSEQDQERIFEPFFTTRLGGNGLGLATTHEIVREHGGAINVTSASGAGSRFDVWLPCLLKTGSLPSAPEETFPLGHGESVLVFEDDVDSLVRHEEILAALGYEAIGFSRLEDAQAACRTTPERFDIILVSCAAPLAAALKTATGLHQLAPDLPMLLVTSLVEEFDTERLIAAGVSDVVPWPMGAAAIATALERCLPRRILRRAEAGDVKASGLRVTPGHACGLA